MLVGATQVDEPGVVKLTTTNQVPVSDRFMVKLEHETG